MEDADRAIVYGVDDGDAAETVRLVEARGNRGLAIKADVRDGGACDRSVPRTVETLGRLDVLVNDAAFQMDLERSQEISPEQFRRTRVTIVFGAIQMTRSAMPHLGEGSKIAESGNIVGMVGNEMPVDHRMANGAIH